MKLLAQQIPSPRLRAFSLVEIMVAVALLAVIIVGLLAMFYQTQKAFRAGLAQSDVMEAGRATMELLTRELSEMSATGLTNVMNYAGVLTSLGVEQPLPGSAQPRTNQFFDLSFMSRKNDLWYGTAYRVEQAGGAGTLLRFQTNAGLYQAGGLSTNLLALPDGDAGRRRVIDGVVHFQVRAYDATGSAFPTNSLEFAATDINDQVFTQSTLPFYVDIELGILEPKAYENLRGRATDAAKINYLEGQVGKVHLFRQRIPVRNAK